jgi:hypothetical protein
MSQSGVTLEAFLTQVIDGGVAGAQADYAGESGNRRQMREGAVRGFEECRLKTPAELALLLAEVQERRQKAYWEQAPDYWYWNCRAAEVEWVCNCVSAVLQNQGLPPIITPTGRGYMRAAEIVGVSR